MPKKSLKRHNRRTRQKKLNVITNEINLTKIKEDIEDIIE